MLRREFLALAAAQTLFSRMGEESLGKESLDKESFGWIPNNSIPDNKTRHLCGFGEDKIALLWKPWKKVIGTELTARVQKHKDCVAIATAVALDILTVVQIAQGSDEQWITKSATDAIYAGGRNNIIHSYVDSGMVGRWAVDYLEKYGNLLMKEYENHDFTKYSEATSMYWENRKLPESLLQEAKLHPLLDHASVKTWPEIRDAIAAGYPILFCSTLGVKDARRDKDGFIKPKGTWYHAWCIIGVDDGRRPGACLLNARGKNWASGPKRHNQPDGSVWVDKSVIEKSMLYGEAHALSHYKGFPAPERKYILW